MWRCNFMCCSRWLTIASSVAITRPVHCHVDGHSFDGVRCSVRMIEMNLYQYNEYGVHAL